MSKYEQYKKLDKWYRKKLITTYPTYLLARLKLLLFYRP